MSINKRTPKEYINLYAHKHCNDDQEEAKTHEIVKEVCDTLEGNEKNGNSKDIPDVSVSTHGD